MVRCLNPFNRFSNLNISHILTSMKRIFLLFALPLLFIACKQDILDTPVSEGSVKVCFPGGMSSNDVVSGVIHIKLKEKTLERMLIKSSRGKATAGIPNIDKLMVSLGATRIEKTFGEGGRFEPRRRKAGLDLWYDVYFDEKIPVTKAFSDFSKIDDIDVVEPSQKINKLSSTFTPVAFPKSGTSKAQSTSHPSGFNDMWLDQQWHYYNDGSLANTIIGADINVVPAWKITTGNPNVIVAIVDEGIDYEHVDLAQNMWVNTAEQNGVAGVDDDNNGYIDDIHGWNFYDNVKEITKCEHATHVAGTVAAVNNNGIGVAGIAGGNGTPNSGARLMSTQIFNSAGSLTSSETLVSKAIVYGADNGAVISQNSWGGHATTISKVLKAAIDYFIDYAGMDETGEIQTGPMRGGIFIVAAGNDNISSPNMPSAYERVLSVVSMGPDFTKASYSTFGTWNDITAPGGDMNKFNLSEYGVLSTLPNNSYAWGQGTSMACPHVSGVAALVVSNYGVSKKGFTNEMLRRILTESANNNIYQYNPDYLGQMGTGCIDAYKALNVEVKYENLPPKPIAVLSAGWDYFNSVKLEWSITTDTEDGKAFYFDIVVSESSFSDVNFPPANSIRKTVAVGNHSVGEKISETIEGLNGNTTYYIAIAARDSKGQRSASSINSGKTINDSEGSMVIYPDINIVKIIDIGEHFNKRKGITYSVSAFPSGIVLASSTNDGVVLLKHVKYGIVETRVHAIDNNGSSVDYIITSVCRDNSQQVDLYPNPVKDILNIRMGKEVSGSIQVDIINNRGIKVFSGTKPISPISLATVDMMKMIAGNYTITITYGNQKLTRSISKL